MQSISKGMKNTLRRIIYTLIQTPRHDISFEMHIQVWHLCVAVSFKAVDLVCE